MTKRPAVEEFKRLCGQPGSWGMADSDVVELCDYILEIEAALVREHPNGHTRIGHFCPTCRLSPKT